MSYKTRRELRREIELKDRMLAHYADMADCVPALASDRERLIRENESLSKRVMLLEKGDKGLLSSKAGAWGNRIGAKCRKYEAQSRKRVSEQGSRCGGGEQRVYPHGI